MSDLNNRPGPDVVNQATEALRGAPVPAGPPAELSAATVAAIEARLTTVRRADGRRRMIMRCVRYGSGLAATVAAVTAVGLMWLGGGRAVALDNVLEKVKTAGSVTFVETEKIAGQPENKLTYSIRGPKARIEVNGGAVVIILDTRSREAIQIVPQLKMYERYGPNIPGNQVAAGNPIDRLLSLRDEKAEALGKEDVGGKPAVKLGIKRPGSVKTGDGPTEWVLWVDPQTELPVKMTCKKTVLLGDKEADSTAVYGDFVWNPKLADALFDMTPPAGYTDGFPGRKPKK